MSQANWAEYIRNKTAFYGSSQARERSDNEFSWAVSDHASGLKRALRALPGIQMLRSGRLQARTRSRSFTDIRKGDLDAIYQVRQMLADETSKILFDEAVVVRLVSHHRYFVSRHTFEDVFTPIEISPFTHPTLPTHYQAAPLYTCRIGVAGQEITVVAGDDFSKNANKWQHYYVKRDGVDFMPQPGDVVFDCGSCTGDIATAYAAMVGPSGAVYGFDPVPLHIRFCELQRSLNPDLSGIMHFTNAGIGSENRVAKDGVDRQEISSGETDIDDFAMVTIDTFVKERGVKRLDLIKMDIEGSERDALANATETIRAFKPKLAISTYHRPDDFWKLPLQIRDMGVGYKFAFSHHSPREWESVIYAY